MDRAARRYVAGPLLADALAVAARITGRGAKVTLGYLNAEDDPPRRVADAHLGAIAGAPAGSRVSIKVPGLGFDPELLDEVLAAAAERDVAVQVDSLRHQDAAPTLALLGPRSGHRSGGEPLGVTLPGRWLRSDPDAEDALQLGLRVRVVKGQFPAPDREARDPTRGALSLVERFAGRAGLVLLASHDPRLVSESAGILRTGETPTELELLYGIPTRRAVGAASQASLPVRLYIPFGSAFLPYPLRGAGPRMAARLIRDLLRSERGDPLRELAGGAR